MCKELEVKQVYLEKIRYIYDNMNLVNPNDEILGKLTKDFFEITGEEPLSPNALYRLIKDTVEERATYEMNLERYDDVVRKKGISRQEVENMLESHKKSYKETFAETIIYIKGLKLKEQRNYNIALLEVMKCYKNSSLSKIKSEIYSFIEKNIEELEDKAEYLKKVSYVLDNKFGVEITDYMKRVLYIQIYHVYASGGEI